MKTATAVTGLGVLTPLGDSPDNIWNAIEQGKSALRPFSDSLGPIGYASTFSEYDPSRYLGPKGFKYYSTCTRYLLSSILPALADAGIQDGGEDLGIVTGTALSAAEEWRKLAQTIKEDGFSAISPMQSYNFSVNMPSSLASIKTSAKAFNVTVCTGTAAGVDAVLFGIEALQRKRAKKVVAAGVEEIGTFAFECFKESQYLAPYLEGQEMPLQSGFSPGEGSAALVLESLEDAVTRGAKIYAVITSVRTGFIPDPGNNLTDGASRFANLILETLAQAGSTPAEVGGIFSGASGSTVADAIEKAALESVFAQVQTPPIVSIKTATGEAFGMSGVLHHGMAAFAIHNGSLPTQTKVSIKKDKPILLTHAGDEGCMFASVICHPSTFQQL